MTECRSITKEEFSSISIALERCGTYDPSNVFRFVDTRLDKVYDVFLLDSMTKCILKRTTAPSKDAAIYRRYFEGMCLPVPKILNTFSVNDDHFVQIEVVGQTDARRCSASAGRRIGTALGEIQSHYLRMAGQTTVVKSYFKNRLATHIDSIKPYYSDYSAVFSYVEKRFFEVPQTLIHDDFLPINVLLDDTNTWIIDWEYADILPYFLDLARFAFIYDMENQFFIPQESADSFLQSYYDQMQKNPKFCIREDQFRLDIAVSAFCQYVLFLSCALNSDDVVSFVQCAESIDNIYFKKIVEHIQSFI